MVPLRAGLPNFAKLEPREGPLGEIPSVCVMLSQDPASTARWLLQLFVQTENNHAELGRMVTAAPASGAQPSRVVLEATCPGALGWTVIATLAEGAAGGTEALDIAASRCCSAPGVHPLEGERFPPAQGSRAYSLYAGANGAVNVPAGLEVVGITARDTAALGTGTVTVGANPPVGVPPGGAVKLAPPLDPLTGHGTLVGPVVITFANTDGYVVEVLG
ncbi:MAG: hypothetical protein IPM35_17025 [Myxococcales bacterium]|nr:hypothetical protein [Myxococcales bacterium]